MSRLVIGSLYLLVTVVGCQYDPPDHSHPGTPGDDDDDGVMTPGRGIAVLNSDYVSTSISLLDPSTGRLRNGNCINSGTHVPGITLALSGDVGLPSMPQPGNLLVAIDHTNSALTWIDTTTCTPVRQLDVSTGFFSNPHDVIAVSETKAYVTRYERHATPTASATDFDEGDDLLIIDPSVPAITGRIDLSSYATTVDGAVIQARPDRARLIDGKLFVVLQNLSGNFGAAGAGRVVVVDTATDQVTATVDLPDLHNCGSLSYVESTQTLVVACGGAYSDPDQAAVSGIAYIDVATATPVMNKKQPVAAFGGRAVAGFSGIGREGAMGFGVTFGDYDGDPKDQFWALNIAAGTANKIADATDIFVFGAVLMDPSHERAYLTDANKSMPRVHVYNYTGVIAREASVHPDPSIGLPPRDLTWY